MYEYLNTFEDLLDEVISNEDNKTFEEFKRRVIERLNELNE